MGTNRVSMTRRGFVGSAVAAATFTIVPRHVLGQGQTPPSEKLRLAFIGSGGQAGASMDNLASQQFVAFCDVDDRRAAGAYQKYPNVKRFRDFRKMLPEVEKEIDAVVVATPDHTHAAAAIAAMKLKKHVYCEKPLAHSIYEVRQMMKAATDNKVVTQMGNQGHSSESIRMFCEWIWDGACGNVHTIHAGCSAGNSAMGQLDRIKEAQPVPEGVDWDLWLGPAQFRPYNRAYMPGSWRSWMPFGTGTIGDWTCHVIDPVFWALDLGSPISVKADAENYDPKLHADTFPRRTHMEFKFAAKGKRGPITLHWYSGYASLPRPEELEPERKVVDTGAVVLGDKGNIMYGSHGAGGVRIFPETKMKAYKLPAKTLPRVRGGNHHRDWLDAIKNGTKAGSDFAAYGGPLTEIALLGVIATKLLGQELKWDGGNMRFTNSEEANSHIKPKFREGWGL